MGHYWAADTPIEIRRELARDWLDDLREFGSDAVAEACGEWRRSQTKRPTPAELRRLAQEAWQVRREPEQAALPAPNYHERRAALAARNADRHRRDVAEGRAICDRWARSRGHADFDAAMRAGCTHLDVVRSILGDAPVAKAFPRPAQALPPHLLDRDVLAQARRELGLPDADEPGVRARLRDMGETA